MFRNFGADIISIEVSKQSTEKTRIRFKVNLDDELDINEILAEIIAFDEVNKAELIEQLLYFTNVNKKITVINK